VSESGVLDGDEIPGGGGAKFEQVDHVAGVELKAEAGLAPGVAAEVAEFAVRARDSVLGLAGEDAVLEELSSEGDSADPADEFREDVPFDLEALGGDFCGDLERGAEGLTNAFAVVVHVRSFGLSVGETLRSQPAEVRRIFPAFSIAHRASPRRWLLTFSSDRSRVRERGRRQSRRLWSLLSRESSALSLVRLLGISR
jgi:hypothetical protein